MIYPLYDFKKRENPDNSQIIAISNQASELLQNLNKTLYALSNQYTDLASHAQLISKFKKAAELHKEANIKLINPPLIISAMGTTSSGKSTFINSLLGLKLSPMNSDELSIGVLKFQHNNELKNSCKITIDTMIANNLWENGSFNKDYKSAYTGIKSIMENYRNKLGKDNLSPPYITVESSFFTGNNPEFIGLENSAKTEIIELPLMIADSESLQFVDEEVKASIVVFLIDYTVLFNKETKETNHLFEKLQKMKQNVGSKDAIIFILNKVDLRNYDDDELDISIEKCKKQIKIKFGIKEDIEVLPLNALLMYYVQCAFLGYENGDLKKYNPENIDTYTDEQKMYIEIIKDNLKKCFKDQAKTISEIQDSSEENVDLIFEIKKTIKKDQIPDYLLFKKFWTECLKKSGGTNLLESIKEKNNKYLKELVLYIPMYKIVNEIDDLLLSLSDQMVIDKINNQKGLEKNREEIINTYKVIGEQKNILIESTKSLIDDSFIKLRSYDSSFKKEAIKVLDIGHVDETIENIRRAVEKETIEPIEQAFIEEKRSDVLVDELIKYHDWDEKIAKQIAEHYDFLRVKLFSEKKYIDNGRTFEMADNDDYEKEKVQEIRKQIEYLCQNLVIAVDQKLKFELQNHIDELAVRVSRWMIKKNKETYDLYEKMLTKLENKYQLKFVEPLLINSFKHDNSFLNLIDIVPVVEEGKKNIEIENPEQSPKSWLNFLFPKGKDVLTQEVDTLSFESIRMQSTKWSSSFIKLEAYLWKIICDSLYTFFEQSLSVYEQINNEIMNQINIIFRQENDKIVALFNKDDAKWKSIENILVEGQSLLKMMHNLTGISESAILEKELARQPSYEKNILATNEANKTHEDQEIL